MDTSATAAQPVQPGQDYVELDKHPGTLCWCKRCGNIVGDTDQHDAWHRYVEQVRGGQRGG